MKKAIVSSSISVISLNVNDLNSPIKRYGLVELILKKIAFSYMLPTRNSGFQGGSVVKNQPAKAADAGEESLIPGLGRSGGGNGNPLQYSCLENSMDRGTWQATVHGVTKNQTQAQGSGWGRTQG